MSENKNDGGPAFPVIADNGLGHISSGMTLRDYFAAHASRSDIEWAAYKLSKEDSSISNLLDTCSPGSPFWSRAFNPSEARYYFADEMLKERVK
jgi:hypothetical protein